jgi:hypothetical protein
MKLRCAQPKRLAPSSAPTSNKGHGHSAILGSVRAGGLLIYETFSQAQANFGRPSRPEFLLQHGELLDICQRAHMHIVAYEDHIVQNPQRAIQRIVARMPPATTQTAVPR